MKIELPLTPHFTLAEMTSSQTAARLGIPNEPSAIVKANLRLTCELLEDVRHLLNDAPIIVTSGYRSPRVNQLVGGRVQPPSAHTKGLAADFIVPSYGSPLAVAKRISESGLMYDQLIYEYESWVHISTSPTPRREDWSIFFGTTYLRGLQIR